jgi:serine/threonine-protein kinase
VDETYEIDAKLGAGAMGEVYAARHIKLGKRVAIKVIGQRLSEDAAAIERFAQEARTLAQIQHPAIVTVDHVGELADGRAYFSMELLRGESLYARLQRGRIQLSEALRILDQMARGLDAAHAQGVVHRDLKPENTFLVQLSGEDLPVVKLLDYGLAKLQADVDRRAERTQSGVAIGTPMYMSPEQARGPDVDHRTDVYALGCVAYELLLGSVPFPHARTAPELYAAHLHEAPPLPRAIWPEIPPQLDLALFAMLAKDPAHRPTLAQVRSVISTVQTTSTTQRAATEIVAPRATKPRAKTLLIVAATLACGIAIGMALKSEPRAQAPSTVPTRAGTLDVQADAGVVEVPAHDAAAALPESSTPPVIQERPRTAKIPGRGSASKSVPVVGTSPPPPDAGTEAAKEEIPPPPPPPPAKIAPTPKTPDRNQTVNPFAKHKVNP